MRHRFINSVPATLFIAILLSSCLVTRQGMYDAFDEDIRHMIGKPHEQAFYGYGCPVPWMERDEFDPSKCEIIDYGFLSPRGGAKKNYLENGNVLHVYDDYWAHKGGYEREPCAVYVEVDPSSGIVVDAWHKGEGCYRAY